MLPLHHREAFISRHAATHATTRTVLVMTHLFPTGESPLQGPWVAEQVDALAGDTEVKVLCCSANASSTAVVRPSGVEVIYRDIRTPLGRGRMGLLASSVRYWRAAARYLDQTAAALGLIHAHFGVPDALVAARLSRRHGLPFAVTLHGDDAFKVLPHPGATGSALRRALRDARAVLCVSDAMAEVVQSVLGPESTVVVAKNGYDDRLFRLSHKPRDLGLLYAGMLVPVKNVDLLLKAYRRIRDRAIDVPLVIAGDGPLKASLQVLARELGVEDSVRFLGVQSREQIADLMQRSRCLALPSSSEGWGMVVAESLACGTPVVASRVGGVPEILREPAGGVLVAPGDVDALSSALASVLAAGTDGNAVARASGARPWAQECRTILQVYGDILEPPRRAQSPAGPS